MTVDDFVSRLDGVRPRGTGKWTTYSSDGSDDDGRGDAVRPTTERYAADEAAHLEDDCIELTIEFAEPLPVRVSEGPHEAVVVSIRRVPLGHWKRECLRFKFKIVEVGPAHGVILSGFVNLGGAEKGDPKKKSKKPGEASKLARWWRVIADHTGGQRKQVSLAEFKQFLFQVVVTNVRTDNRGQPISDAAQGQVISEIVAIVAALGTGQPAPHPPSHSVQNDRSTTTKTSGYPRFLAGLGPFKKGSVNRCDLCNEPTAFSYGCRPFCCMHARQHAEGTK